MDILKWSNTTQLNFYVKLDKTFIKMQEMLNQTNYLELILLNIQQIVCEKHFYEKWST